MKTQNDTHPSYPDLCLTFVKGGSFSMGDKDGTTGILEHEVKVSSYYIGKYLVTQRLWHSLMGNNPSFSIGGKRPVETVSWSDAQDFIKKLNSCQSVQNFLQNLDPAGTEFRLPTEAEWEYAARGGNKSRGFVYSGNDKLKEVGWYDENSSGEIKPVGLKFPNELGLFDMSGNVWEWCQDWYGEDYYEQCAEKGLAIDPQGPDEGVDRVLRGGSSFRYPLYCRAAYRYDAHPEYRDGGLGFRLVVPCQLTGKPDGFH